MKCDDEFDGPCPFRGSGDGKVEGYCFIFGEVGHVETDERLETFIGCHLTPADFPLIAAAIKGEGRLWLTRPLEAECPNCNEEGCADCFQAPPTNFVERDNKGDEASE